MSNLTRYNINGEGFTYIRPDPSGQWVKFDDIEELLQTTPNRAIQQGLAPHAEDGTSV